MALSSSGPIRLGADVNVELGLSATAQASLGSAGVRGLYGVASGPIRLAADGYGKSHVFVFNQTIASNTNDYNLKNAAIAAGWDQVIGLQATVTINSDIFVGSSSTGTPAFTTGSTYPAGSTLAIINNGFIVGRGGNGGSGGGSGGGGGAGVVNSSGGARGTWQGTANPGNSGAGTTGGAGGVEGGTVNSSPGGNDPTSGSSGGLALQVLASLTLTNNGTIGGGGGGGGGGGVSVAAFPPNPQELFIVTNKAGGSGGALGTAGSAGVSGGFIGGSGGGGAGAAITGNSNINYLATGTRLGAIS